MKKWLFIGLGGLLLAAIIDGIICYKKERAKTDDEIGNALDEAIEHIHRKNEEFKHHAEGMISEMNEKERMDQIAETMDHICDEVNKSLDKDPEEILKTIILENGENAQEWIDRVLSMDQNRINLELKIDP